MGILVLYAKVADDKEMGTLMTGIYIGGVADNECDANMIAKRCVQSVQGAMVITRMTEMHDGELLPCVKSLEHAFDKIAERMYQNERILKRPRN